MARGKFPRAMLSMAIRSTFATSTLITAATLSMAPVAWAQETTSGIRGQVTSADGSPVENATITVVYTPSNSRTQITTNESGRFSAKGLRVGGPYHISVDSPAGTRELKDIYLNLGDVLPLNLEVGGSQSIEEVTVIASQGANTLATGPSSQFSLIDLQNAPAINRDIKDLVRLDPRIYIDEAFSDSIQCTGANPRFNSLTVDGVRMNDNFGLNSNGYPTERMPFSYDAIDQVAVELAPFDVQYGGFSACNINAVTKSGSNEFKGSVFYDYTDDSLSGDSLEGDDIEIGNFDEKRYGVSFGGPIIEDTLFFFASYEKLEGADTFDRGPAGSGAAREIQGVSREQLDEIIDIARNIYNYDPGSLPTSLPVEDEKLLVRVDWNINDYHRASFVYNYNDGFSIAQSDGDSDELELSNHYYERGAQITSYVGHVFSDWAENFSTELKIGYSELDNRQLSLGGTDFGEVQIFTSNDHDNDGNASDATVYLGADDSRHANKLSYETFNFKFTGTYLLGNQELYFGIEREEFDVFNLFIQEAEGEYRFAGIDNFRNAIPTKITYENAAFTNNADDAAAEFGYAINTLYAQYEYSFSDPNLIVTGGLRYDRYTSSDKPVANPVIEQSYGFSNQQNLDGLDLLQPRLGVNWYVDESLEIHGGIGLYSGGNPNVWISNNYSNDGITQIEVVDESGTSLFDRAFNGQGRPIYDIPQDMFDAVAAGAGSNGGVNIQDPDFETPSVWKYSLGGSYEFAEGYLLSADFLYSNYQDAAIIRDISRVQVGNAIDGRPIYASGNGRRQDFMLTNVSGDSGSSTVLSLGISKSFEFGLDVALGYAYTDAEDVNPMTSSVAFSNYSEIAVSDPENPGVATSNYEIPHRITLKLSYHNEFVPGYETRVTLFGSANEGRPYAYTFDSGFMFGDSVGFISRSLLYVPTGVDDANVVFGDDFDKEAFFAFVDDENLSSGIMDRNELNSHWWTKFDVKLEQELPGFGPDQYASAYLVVENLGNLLNDEWGVMRETSFPRAQAAVDANIDGEGRYVFNRFLDPAKQSRVTEASLWEIRFGVRYSF